MLRMTDLDTGKSVELAVEEILMECFREQIDRGRNPGNLKAFRRRLGHGIEKVIADAVDLSLQPPLSSELNQAFLLATALRIPVPEDALRRRSILLRFLRAHEPLTPLPSCEAATEQDVPTTVTRTQ